MRNRNHGKSEHPLGPGRLPLHTKGEQRPSDHEAPQAHRHSREKEHRAHRSCKEEERRVTPRYTQADCWERGGNDRQDCSTKQPAKPRLRSRQGQASPRMSTARPSSAPSATGQFLPSSSLPLSFQQPLPQPQSPRQGSGAALLGKARGWS